MVPYRKDIIANALRKRIRSETEQGRARNTDRRKSDAGKRVDGGEGAQRYRAAFGKSVSGGGGGVGSSSSRRNINTPFIRSRQTAHKEYISPACESTDLSTSPGIFDAALIEALRKRFLRQTDVLRNLFTRRLQKRRTAKAWRSEQSLHTCRNYVHKPHCIVVPRSVPRLSSGTPDMPPAAFVAHHRMIPASCQRWFGPTDHRNCRKRLPRSRARNIKGGATSSTSQKGA